MSRKINIKNKDGLIAVIYLHAPMTLAESEEFAKIVVDNLIKAKLVSYAE